MTRDHEKATGNWATAQMPRLVQGQILSEAPVSPAQKHLEAEQLRAAVEAHIARNGSYQILPSTGAK